VGDRVAMLVVHAGTILMVRQRYRGRTLWVLPGGSPHPGESPQTTAAREVLEETGLVTAPGQLLLEVPRPSGTGRYQLVAGRLVGGQQRLGSDRDDHGRAELLEVGWRSPDQLDATPERDLILTALQHPYPPP